MSDSRKTTWRCHACGSDEIEELAWVRLKDETVQTWDENSHHWCPQCQEHVPICEVSADGRCLSHEQPFAACRAESNESEAPRPAAPERT
jgi:hypothetical protein